MTTGNEIVAYAQNELGKPYVYGAEGPSSFDCSGLVQYIFNKAGVKVPRVSSAQYSYGDSISYQDLQPGDLVFSEWPGDDVPHHGHVAIYTGNGKIIEAPHPGGVVQEIPLNSYYLQHVDGYTRPPGLGTLTPATQNPGGNGVNATNASFDWNPLSWPGKALGWASGGITSDVSQLVQGAISGLANITKFFMLFFQASTYIRIGAGIFGFIFFTTGLKFLMKESDATV